MRKFVGIVQCWHWGKLVILWSWGGVLAGLLWSVFASTTVREHPVLSLATLLGSVGLVAGLTGVTWVWLGGKEGTQ